jgi:hypothetical protein
MTSRTLQLLGQSYRSHLPFGLDDGIWAKILAQATDAENLLSHEQQKAVVRWAFSRETLWQERAELGKQRQNQIWMVLHGMNCLSYGLEGSQ